jgi:hypothetical protein
MTKFGIKKSVCTVVFLFLLFHINDVSGQFFMKSGSGSTGVYINNSVYVSSNGSLFINGNLYCQDISFTSNGEVTVYSSDLSEVVLPSEFSGSGTLIFEGEGDFDVSSSSDFTVNNFTVNTDGTVELANNFNVGSTLTLTNGIVDVASPNVLLAQSDDESAIAYSSDLSSYVIGYLGRSTTTSGTFYYPVGESSGAFPLYITEPASADVLVARYDKNIGEDAESALESESLAMLSESGWEVYGESVSQNEYLIGLWAPEQADVSTSVGILYSEVADFSDYSETFNTENTSESYLASTDALSNGYFALVSDNSDGIDDDIILRNFFIVGGGNSTTFEIPDASTYDNIQMTLYNKIGTRLFYADSYTNQLDLADFPTGTYYYELILEKSAKKKKIYNFIEVKNESY